MRKLISSFYKREEEDSSKASLSPIKINSISSRAGVSGKFDNSAQIISATALNLSQSIQSILSNIANYSSENLIDYHDLLLILDDRISSESGETAPNFVSKLLEFLDHPNFVECCFQANLATGLYQALRLLRMLELIQGKSVDQEPPRENGITYVASLNIFKLLIFPLNSLPLQGKHLQLHSSQIVASICRLGFTSQQVWFLHDSHYINYALRLLTEMTDLTQSAKEDNVVLLRGLSAESEGIWIEALKCFIDVLNTSIIVSSALLIDFESLSGNKLLLHILSNCSAGRFLRALNIVSTLLVSSSKKDDESIHCNSTTAVFRDLLVSILQLREFIHPSTSIETLVETAREIVRGELIFVEKEYIFQSLSYAILTMYSTDPSHCLRLEEKYNILPTLIICLPSFSLEESISAILTTFNYICQCVESTTPTLFLSMNASISLLVGIAVNEDISLERRSAALHSLELCFSSIEAISRTNINYAAIFLRFGLMKFVVCAAFDRLHSKLAQGFILDDCSIFVYARILSLLTELIGKGTFISEEIRRSGLSGVLSSIINIRSIPANFARLILALFEEMERSCGSSTGEPVTLILELLSKELPLQFEKVACLFESLWKILVVSEGKAISLLNTTKEVSFAILSSLKGVFNNSSSTSENFSVLLDCIESILKFLSVYIYYAEGRQRDTMLLSKISCAVVESGIFNSPHANHGIVLLLDFSMLFTKEKSRIDEFASEVLLTIPPFLDKKALFVLLTCLKTYLVCDESKCVLLCESEICSRFFESLYQAALYDLELEILLTDILLFLLQFHQSVQLSLLLQKYSLRAVALPMLDSLDWVDLVKASPTQPSGLKSVKPKLSRSFLQQYFPDYSANKSFNVFGNNPSFDLPLIVEEQECISQGSLAFFFNDATVQLPANALSISCWFFFDESSYTANNFDKFALFSLETVFDRVIISLELTSIADELMMKFLHADSGREEGIKFKLQSLAEYNLTTWTNAAITIKRMKRFAQSSQIIASLHFNGLVCLPISKDGSSLKASIDLDCLTVSQHGEIRLGNSRQTWSNSSFQNYSSGKIHFGAFSVFNEAITQRQVFLLYLKGPSYVGLHPEFDNECVDHLCSYAIRIASTVSRHALLYLDRIGLKGMEAIVELRDLELGSIPDPIATISANLFQEDKVFLTLCECEAKSLSSPFMTKKFQVSSRPRRFSLLSATGFESENFIGILTSPGLPTRKVSLGGRISGLGGAETFVPLLLLCDDEGAVSFLLEILQQSAQQTLQNLTKMQSSTYQMIGFIVHFLWARSSQSFSSLQALLGFGIASVSDNDLSSSPSLSDRESHLIVDTLAIAHLIYNHQVWNSDNFEAFSTLLRAFKELVTDDKYKGANILRLSCLGFTRWIVLACVNTISKAYQKQTKDSSFKSCGTFESEKQPTELGWTYYPRTSMEMADYRDEQEEFLTNANTILRSLLTSDLRTKDVEIITNTIQFTFNISEGSANYSWPTGLGKSNANKYPNSNFGLHPFCTYETQLNESDSPQQPETILYYLNPFEFYRIYLLRLLVLAYDDNFEEFRKRRASSNQNSSANSNGTAKSTSSTSDCLEIYREKCSPEWFLSILDRSEDVAATAQILRLLAFFFEKDAIFVKQFVEVRGFQTLHSILCLEPQSIPVLLPILSMLFHIPVQLLLYPFQLKSVQKLSQLLELDEYANFSYVNDPLLTQYSLPLLNIFYECLTRIVRSENSCAWQKRAEELLIGVLESAVHHSVTFKRLMQNKLALEIHIIGLLSCSNAFSDYGSTVYGAKKDSVDLTKSIEEDYITIGRQSNAFLESTEWINNGTTNRLSSLPNNVDVVEEEKSNQQEIRFHNNDISIPLQRMMNYFIRYAIRDEDNSRMLYHLFLSVSTLSSLSFERSYQNLIVHIFAEIAKESQGLENAIIGAISRNITYVIPLARGLQFFDETVFELMKICISLVETISSMYEINELNENLQFILKDLVGNARFFCFILFYMQSNPSYKSYKVSRLGFFSYLRSKLDYFFHPLFEDSIEALVFSSSRFSGKSGIDDLTITAAPMLEALQGLASSSQRKSAIGQITNIRNERNRCTTIFCAQLIYTAYYLVLDEEAALRTEATRILAYLSQRRALITEQLVSNSSPFVSRLSRTNENDSAGGVDIYKEGLLKLVPNSDGKYDLFLRGGTLNNESEENRFADFSFWISDNSKKCDLVFRAIEHGIHSFIPNISLEAEELSRRLKHKTRARDLFLQETAESIKASLQRKQIGLNNGQKICKQFVSWKNEGLKELTAGAMLWKKSWANLKSTPLWGYGRTLSESSEPNLEPSKFNGRIVWKVDYCEGPERSRKKLLQDVSSFSPRIFGENANGFSNTCVIGQSLKSATSEQRQLNEAPNEDFEDILHSMQKQGVFRRTSSSSSSNYLVMNEDETSALDLQNIKSLPHDPISTQKEGIDNKLDYVLGSKILGGDDVEEDLIESGDGEVEIEFDNVGGYALEKIIEDDEGFLSNSVPTRSQTSPIRVSNSLNVSRASIVRETVKGIINIHELKSCAVYNIERISGLETQKSIFVLSDHYVHVLVGFAVKDRKAKFADLQFEWIPQSTKISSLSSGNGKAEKLEPGIFSLDEISDTAFAKYIWADLLMADSPYLKIPIDERRHQLRYCALEISDVRGGSVLFSCISQQDCDEILATLLEKELPSSIFNKIISLKNLQLLRGATNMYNRLISIFLNSITQSWQHGEITNFEYLMYVNSAAGRSFLDLTQYPVFPWILADYKSEELDLEDPTIYRDLTKPMGALGLKRAQQYLERFQTMDEFYKDGVEGSSPPFFYGTHYSCAGYVLHYLVRLQPYTNMSLALQGGTFDKADRLFSSIENSWVSASAENLQDVRELTPEFFYLPDFLINVNQFDLGVTQSDRRVDNVKLPPWAKNDPRLFIKIHRQALESRFVTENLHHWIDLIFGFKQRGKAAVDAMNVFIHITYEGEVDLDAIDDPILQNATLSQINNFGQTPSKIFQKPHPKKVVPEVVKKSNDMILVEPSALVWHSHLSPALTVVGAPKFTILKCINFGPGSFQGTLSKKGVTTSLAVADLRLLSRDRILACPVGSMFLPPNYKKLVRYKLLADGLALQTFHTFVAPRLESERDTSYYEQLHTKRITCISICKNGEFIVSGSEDLTVRVWQLVRTQTPRGPQLLPVCTFLGHDSEVACVDISCEFNIVVSGSKDRTAIIWDYRSQCMIRILGNQCGAVISVAVNSISGCILTLTREQIRIYHLNGQLIGLQDFLDLNIVPATVVIAPPCGEWQDGVIAVTGHIDGTLYLWKLSKNPFSQQKAGLALYTIFVASTLTKIHKSEISCIRLCSTNKFTKALINKAYEDSRNMDLLIGDIDGNVSRWTVAKLDQLPQSDLNSLIKNESLVSKA